MKICTNSEINECLTQRQSRRVAAIPRHKPIRAQSSIAYKSSTLFALKIACYLIDTALGSILSRAAATMVNHHFLILVFPTQSHVNPALHLAKRLIALGAHVTVSTTLHIDRRMNNKPNLPGLSFAPFSDGYDGGFSPKGRDHFLHFSSELKRRGSEFVTNLIVSNKQEGHPFTCIVYTVFFDWAIEVAHGFNLPWAILWVEPAIMLNMLYHFFHGYRDYLNEKMKEPSSFIELPGLPTPLAPSDAPSFFLASTSDFASAFEVMFEDEFRAFDLETNPPRVLLNTFEALEPEVLRAIDDKFNLMPIGPMVDTTDTSSRCDLFRRSDGYLEWLDSKPDLSVVYVSFGSIAVPPKIQMEEIGRALLDSGRPFLWVIREKVNKGEEVVDKVVDLEELSCREELEQRGKIVKWCSQLDVLSHPSLGCFLTHCGWNSTLESLVWGVPVVAFPLRVDQKPNAKLIEDVWKTGVRVDTRSNKEEIAIGGAIRECLELVMGSGKRAEEMRRNAKKWKELGRQAVKEASSPDKNLISFLVDA